MLLITFGKHLLYFRDNFDTFHQFRKVLTPGFKLRFQAYSSPMG